MKNQSSAIEQLDRYIRARYPAIAILSHEESRVMASIQAVAEHVDARWLYGLARKVFNR